MRCPDCGNPIDVCSDPERAPRYPYRRICYSSMEREAAQAAYEAKHEKAPWHDGTFESWAGEQSPEHPYHFRHGVTVGVADRNVAPWDKFTTKAKASPIAPSDHVQ
jgi:predicted amidophosphoribosyltransferase